MESYRNFGCGGNCRSNSYHYNQSRNMNPYANMGCGSKCDDDVIPTHKSTCGCNTVSVNKTDCGCREMFETEPDCGCKSPRNTDTNNCSFMHKNRPCGEDCSFLGHMPVGMGYVPMQEWCEMYDKKTALCQGTAFPDLNLIFCGIRGKR